jgi:NAD-dependent DNA ligase
MNDPITDYDDGQYKRYIGPAVLNKELNTLKGIIEGIEIDQLINDKELTFLSNWLENTTVLSSRKPFDELVKKVKTAIADKFLDEEEKKDILWFCEQIRNNKPYYDMTTSLMQSLHGILAGVAADRVINPKELNELGIWIDNHRELEGTWPFDEIDSLIVSVLADKQIDEKEHRFLLSFCSEFVRDCSPLLLEGEFKKELIYDGICAMDPSIEFKGNCFCCTGESKRATRKEIAEIIESFGGRFSKGINQSIDYLVVGSAGNKAWAFSCYGRKVEEVMNLRKNGLKIQLIHEFDFWDAVEDEKINLKKNARANQSGA